MAEQESKASVFGALAANLAIAATKLAASIYTGSSAMLTEAIHSAVDTGNQGLLLLGMHRAKRPPSPSHPMGYGMELYFWTFVVSLTIFALGGAFSIYEGYEKILEPEPITSGWVSIGVLIAALIFEGSSLAYGIKTFRRTESKGTLWQAMRRSKDPSSFAVIVEDTAAVIGLLFALVGISAVIYLDYPVADGIASVGIGVLLIVAAAFLGNETLSLLTGEAASRDVVEKVRKVLDDDARIVEVVEVLSLHLGPSEVLIGATVDFADACRGDELEDAVRDVTQNINHAVPEVTRVFVRPGQAASPERRAA